MKKNKRKIAPKQRSSTFKVGDAVGAKLKGYPMWPGRIEKIDPHRKKYTVRFFHTDDSSDKCIELKLFKDFTEKERANKKKGFPEALKICQKYYDEQKGLQHESPKDDEESEDSESEAKLQIKEEQELPVKNTTTTTKTKISSSLCDEVPMDIPSDEVKEEPDSKLSPNSNTSPESLPTTPTEIKTTAELTNGKQEKPVKIEHSSDDLKSKDLMVVVETTKNSAIPEEGNNVMQSSNKNQIVEKLKKKVDAKIRQKEELKLEKMNQKLGEKASKNFPKIETQLNMLCNVFGKYRKPNSPSHSNVDQWNVAVRKYNSLIPKLENYIRKYFMTNYNLDSKERKECHRILHSICGHFNFAKECKKLPTKIQKDFKKMRKNMCDHSVIKDFINGKLNIDRNDSKNAMTERKENDADELK